MAAAAALSSHSLSSVPRLYASRKPSKTLEFKALTLQSIIQHPRQSRLCSITNVGFQMSKPLLVPRRSVKSFLCTEESEPGTIDGEEEDDQNNQVKPELKTLIKVYKEAVLDGDEKTVSEIEAMICIIENEKNELVEKVAALSADTISGKDKYLRLKADFENFRKRSDKEKLTIIADAQGEVIESLLPMIDNFERAKQQIKTETEKEKSIDTSYQGIYKQFVEIMKSMNVAVVPTVGKPFDPSLHEAIAREESTEFKEGIIVQEFRRGFFLGDRLLRPAMVKVSAGPGDKKAPVSSNSERSSEQPTATTGLDDDDSVSSQ